jgi:Rieske 2Fe-2S family protein
MERTLQRDFYFSGDIFQREKERIFFREWFCAGREEEVPNPGDYLVLDVAGESVLVVRTSERNLAAHYNVCRHRGSRLVLEGCKGSFAGGIRCPYHSWTYTLDGSLRTAPFLDQNDGFAKQDLALHPVGVANWGGFFFLNLTPAEAGSRGLQAQLGGIPERLRRYPLQQLRSARRMTYEVDANWKVILENYNECYHCGPVHPELCRLVPAFKQRGGSELDWERGIPHREGAWTFTESGTTNRRPFEGLDADERVRHKGELIYPNFMISLSADHVTAYTLWPREPEHTTILCDFLFHPSELERGEFDPADAVNFWDLVNHQDWAICENVQRGMRSRVFQHGFYAPMENASLDIRRYITEKLGG